MPENPELVQTRHRRYDSEARSRPSHLLLRLTETKYTLTFDESIG